MLKSHILSVAHLRAVLEVGPRDFVDYPHSYCLWLLPRLVYRVHAYASWLSGFALGCVYWVLGVCLLVFQPHQSPHALDLICYLQKQAEVSQSCTTKYQRFSLCPKRILWSKV